MQTKADDRKSRARPNSEHDLQSRDIDSSFRIAGSQRSTLDSPRHFSGFTRLITTAFFAATLAHASDIAATTPSLGAPRNVQVPTLAYDEQSIVLVWEKPAPYAAIADYHVYMNGKKLGSAVDNAAAHSPAKKYFDAFYAADPQGFHVRVSHHSFKATGLQPDTAYVFTVRSVGRDGRESADSPPLTQRTTPVPRGFDVTTFGALGDGVKTNTKEIQAAIDACTPGGKVLIPAGVFRSGALFLKSEMTFAIAEGGTLLGSDDPGEYPLSRGYRLYPYSTHERPPSLLNVLSAEPTEGVACTNLRIVGPGTIDGNGWKRAAKPVLTDETGRELPQYVKSNNSKVANDGLLAKTQTERGVSDGLDLKTAYGQRRSSLVTLRAVKNLYLGDFTAVNPANHALMCLECEQITVRGVRVETWDANNADGVELGNCDSAIICDNFFDTGDDSINFAAGTGLEAAKQHPEQKTWIFGNYCRRGHGAVVVGSHTGAWIQGILAEDNIVVGNDAGLRCKSSPINGGGGRDIVFRDTAMRDIAKQAFIFTLEYNDKNAAYDYEPAKESAVFRDITVQNVTVEKCRGKEPSLLVKGAPDKGIFHERLVFENVALVGSNPALIHGLKSSQFHNVVFTDAKPEQELWTVTRSDGLIFDGTTRPPKP